MTQNPEESATHGSLHHLNPETLHKNPAFTHVITVTGPAKTIYIGGQDAVDAQGNIVGKRDLAAQTHQVLRNLHTTLAEASARPEHIITNGMFTWFRGNHCKQVLRPFNSSGYQPNPPTITGIFVSGLAHPDFLVEMDAIAVVPL